MPPSTSYRPAPRHPTLGPDFYDEVRPARFPRHQLRFRNQRAAAQVGLDTLDDGEWEAHFARFQPLRCNLVDPLALRYHGHQFDVYNPHLGDGRGFLFAQLMDDQGRLLDLGTKGSGTTPWSRGGDGRLTLKGGVREVLATEMLEALGVPTSRSFSLFETGEQLLRGDEPSPTRSSVLVRLSHSHVRIGTFQRLAHQGDTENLERLLSHCIRHYFPDVGDDPGRAARFVARVTRACAVQCAAYMASGFVHGVLNSDNLNITGESFDYGPYRFLPAYDEGFVAAYFDSGGLYAFGQQPRAFLRNLARLAEALRPIARDIAIAPVRAEFEVVLERELTTRVLARMGLASSGDADGALVAAAFAFLRESGATYDRFFFDVRTGRTREEPGLYRGARWQELSALLALYTPNRDRTRPILCSLLIDEIEAIWESIAERDDWGPFAAKISEIRAMGAAGPATGAPEGGRGGLMVS